MSERSMARRESERQARARRRLLLLVLVTLAPLVAAVAAGLVVLWPSGDRPSLDASTAADAPGTRYESGVVLSVRPFDCQGTGAAPGKAVRCDHLGVRIRSGPDQGRRITVDIDPTVARSGVHPGDRVQLARFKAVGSQPASYVFVDFARGAPLTVLTVVFAVLVVVVARWRGFAALIGLVISFAVLLTFMIPALLEGTSPLPVAFVGCSAIMLVVLYVAHGVSFRTTAALFGTLFGLAAAAALGTWAVDVAHFTGVTSEEDFTLTAIAGQVRLTGLLLAGIVVASLGVLNDVTVTQASAVWELSALDPGASRRRLFTGAMRIGRDHIASTVYTIVFAYAGTALPILLLITLSQRPLGTTLTSELVGQEIARTMVGSIALVLAVPLTTLAAVLLAHAAPSAVHLETSPGSGHSHRPHAPLGGGR